ncbi:MAG: winged helix-turn-helix domain-containing protein [Thermofilum sp.]|uniref:winged helix-turn-helix domain-containing protein n=1 Tax=Thermofilum sp. TaxID=1961369 RepID=UPI002590F37C|nr:winged helix-turn-helix domain-containing protein [Thermofilum sp.]MCI4409126.1 winged helix-turn-helix domain-containing protein [Thermofilum sp.]
MSVTVTVAKRRNKRSKLEIMYSILEKVSNGGKKTHIMYGANLSYDLTVKYLKYLSEKGFVVEDNGIYTLTESGKRLLEVLREYVKKKAEFNEALKKVWEILPEEKPQRKRNGKVENTNTAQQQN